MDDKNKTTRDAAKGATSTEQWPGIDSMYRLIVVAALRNKQLLRGARPRIDADPRKRKNASIALEEVKQGLVPFTLIPQAKVSQAALSLVVTPDGS
ncbi:MAG TPA: DNA-directed RNA polymerase subunit omega [Pyrinomonadaceae bacterium]|jgi:DNA-directed RNA polymerase omega subunit